jgi:hypothetical protein
MSAAVDELIAEGRQALARGDGSDSMDGFAQMNAGTISPAEFFARENIGRITAAAGGVTAHSTPRRT